MDATPLSSPGSCLKTTPEIVLTIIIVIAQRISVRLSKTAVSPRSSPKETFREEERSATQRQKFHTDDVNQCLHDKSGSHGVPNANLFNFTFLLVDFGKVFCSSANKLQQNSNAFSREEYIP